MAKYKGTAWLIEDYPDARLNGPMRREHHRTIGGVVFERVFCVNCGTDGGGVLAENAPHVFYLCDECARKWGDGGLQKVPDEFCPRTKKLYLGTTFE